MVRGDVLQIVAFSVLFALAVSAVGEKGKANRPGDGKPVADHVQVYKLRDAVCTDRRRRSDGTHGWHARLGRAY